MKTITEIIKWIILLVVFGIGGYIFILGYRRMVLKKYITGLLLGIIGIVLILNHFFMIIKMMN